MNGISNSFSNRLRLTGMTGFDTESMIQQLMQAEKIPLNSLFQKRTLVEWKRDAYRDVTNSLRGIKSTFFDVVNRSSYLLSENSIKTMSAKASSSKYLDVTASAGAQPGSTLAKVLQIATASSAASQTKASSDISGVVTDFNLAGKSIRVTLDGVSKEVSLENYTTGATSDIADKIEASLHAAFGAGKFNVTFDSTENRLSIGTIGGATKVTVYDPTNSDSGLDELGLTPGASNRLTSSYTLAELKNTFNVPLTFSDGGTVDFTINGKLISADATDTLAEVFQKINNTPEAGVTIKYDELTDKVSISSTELGETSSLALSDENGSFLQAMGLIDGDNNILSYSQGHDAKVELNGAQEIVRSTNTFTVNGVTYSLKAAHPVDEEGDTITVSQDVDAAVKNIKSFVEKYNELIDNLNGKITEKYDRDYLPLTDEQKETMKDEDVERWDKKAKTGLLRNDPLLREILQDMRTAMYETVEGAGISLKEIGIGSKSYTDNGKLTIDEDKLTAALRNNPDKVAKLLNGTDPNNPSYSRMATRDQRQSRYSNSGIFHRISDIIEDNISTFRDADGNKGILLMKAGIEGDFSSVDNVMTDELDRYDERISEMLDKLEKKEESYYLKFSKLETMLNQMNAQSSWLTSQLNGGQ